MTDCADSTSLRAHLDHPDAELDAHLDACGACTGLLRSVAHDAGIAQRALALLDPPVGGGSDDIDIEAALSRALAASAPAPVLALAPARRPRIAVMGRRLAFSSAAALLAVVVVLTPTGRSAVAGMLDAFRGERLQVLPVDTDSWAASFGLDDAAALEALGDIDTSGLTEPREVVDVAEAETVAGIAAPQLPGAPDRLVALAPDTARLVLVARDDNDVPTELDGAALVVDVPGAIGAIYGPTDGPPELVIGRSGPLIVRAEGAPLETIRSFVLSHDELPADLRGQLAAIDDWRSTIPVPVPLDGPGWEEVDVGGSPAVAFGDDSGIGAVVIRQDPDGVTVVGGRITVSRALELADRA